LAENREETRFDGLKLWSSLLFVAGGLWLWFLVSAVRLWRERTPEVARHVFWVSLIYLMGTFMAMLADLALGAWT